MGIEKIADSASAGIFAIDIKKLKPGPNVRTVFNPQRLEEMADDFYRHR